jgi:uncharacterized small protein (DUF1192 family)
MSTLTARVAYLDAELTRLVAAREEAHARDFQRWAMDVAPRYPDAAFIPAPSVTALDMRIHSLLDELEELTDQMEQAT